MPAFVTTLVTCGRADSAAVVAQASRAAHAGIDVIQIREKTLGGRALAELVDAVLVAVRGTGTRIVVNGRPDVAYLCGAQGVHLPEAGLPIAAVRRHFPALLVGASCHSLDAAVAAGAAGADFVLLGPVFPTPGKVERALGLELLRSVVDAVRVPVHAVGGVGPGNVRAVRDAGAAGAAAIRAFARDPERTARAMREALA